MSESIDLMAAILEASTESAFLAHLQTTAIACGFEHASICLQWLDPQGESHHRECSGHPPSRQRGHSCIDPVVAHGLSSTDPLLWTTQQFNFNSNSNRLHLLESGRERGVAHGISIPTHDALGLKSMVCLVRSQAIVPDSVEAAQLLRKAKVVAAFAHIAYRNLTKEEVAIEPARPLSAQEKSCLRWVATGKTSWEVGKILEISESTAIFHIKNVMGKLGVKSRAQAIAVAFRLGLLN